jgi:hypothetical protein
MARFHGNTACASLHTSWLKAMARSIGALPPADEKDRISLRVGLAIYERVARLARSVAQIEVALRRAERTIQAAAPERIHMLRQEATEQLAILHGHQRDASRLLWRLATAAEGSWGNLEEAADRSLTAARITADSLLKRLRRAAGRRITARRVPSNGG